MEEKLDLAEMDGDVAVNEKIEGRAQAKFSLGKKENLREKHCAPQIRENRGNGDHSVLTRSQ